MRSTCTATAPPTSRPSTPTDVDAIAGHITTTVVHEQLFPDLRNGPFWDGPRWLNSPSITGRGYVLMATGVISVALARPLADALAILRAHAFAADRTVDDAAHDIVTGSLSPYRLTPDSNMLTNPSKPNGSEGPREWQHSGVPTIAEPGFPNFPGRAFRRTTRARTLRGTGKPGSRMIISIVTASFFRSPRYFRRSSPATTDARRSTHRSGRRAIGGSWCGVNLRSQGRDEIGLGIMGNDPNPPIVAIRRCWRPDRAGVRSAAWLPRIAASSPHH